MFSFSLHGRGNPITNLNFFLYIYTFNPFLLTPHQKASQTWLNPFSFPFFSLRLPFFLGFFISSAESRPPFACDPRNRANLPIHVRARDLIGRLTLAEKIRLLVNNAAAVPRLGIQGYEWWSEALHGVSNVGPGSKFGGAFPGATSFPQVITTAASFNESLWEQIGRPCEWGIDLTTNWRKVSMESWNIKLLGYGLQVVSDEARAMFDILSPNVNIFRDPRWGRGQETPGEDPVLAGKYAANYVRGLQSPTGIRLKVAACCKHYTAYDLDNWNGVDRYHFNARVSKQDLADTYDVAIQVLCGGRESCKCNVFLTIKLMASPLVLTLIYSRYIVSDCDSVGVMYDTQHFTATPEDQEGLLAEADVDLALANTINNPNETWHPSAQPYGNLGPRDVCTPAHQQLALEAARQSIVLLKNSGSLPLSTARHRTVAVMGPTLMSLLILDSFASFPVKAKFMKYDGSLCFFDAGVACGYTSPLQGISRYARTIHQAGCSDVACDTNNLFGVAEVAAHEADATVVVMGLDQSIEAEFRDRVGLLLPGRQQELVSRVARASRGPTVLVLMSGGPIDVSFAKNDPRVSAIIWAGYPGQAGGTAIADVLFGTTNPGGKLPMTWYPQDYVAKVPMTNMGMRPSRGYPGRTYRFYKGPVLQLISQYFLTPIFLPPKNYSTLSSNAIRVKHAKCDSLSSLFHIDVENTGNMDGTHTLLFFSTPPAGQKWSPNKH
ncbi:hypothetical protein CXB51_025317 [Gossypium anomalum]|uniref:Fibronectin type III-like domain-containing protein n=1 Tax=Gossypium anomalum TaxID=47600 RepID=A0A8J5YAG0_9ROSI|nr:hypothetical protein CXB51_025317 [Gossypium anomalum]